MGPKHSEAIQMDIPFLKAMVSRFAMDGDRQTGYITVNPSHEYYINRVVSDDGYMRQNHVDLVKGLSFKEFGENDTAVLEVEESTKARLDAMQRAHPEREWILHIRAIGMIHRDGDVLMWEPDEVYSLDLILKDIPKTSEANEEEETV